ncbi:MAG: GspH/FimT family pseudopilin [Betaproteobacteria bacterium]|jgi:type IV fimbrial biogenesis protein FimT
MLDALKLRRHAAMDQGAPRKLRGLTLIELMVTVVIVTILVVLAVPSFNTFLARGRLTGAAEALAQDLQLSRSEALRSNADVTLSLFPGNAWCYGSVAGNAACTCTTAATCTLRQVDNTAYTGVTMTALTFTGNATTFTARQGLADAGTVDFRHPNAGTLRVSLGAAGQVSICSTSGALGHHPAC